jgi:chitin disaccharide deacetylase
MMWSSKKMIARRANRCLIVNADDFGQSVGVNAGIIEAHERGIVTSASLMVGWPGAAEAAAYGRNDPTLSLGLHFDLGEWRCCNGRWTKVYEVVSVEDASAVAKEAFRQLTIFRSLVGKDPTHLDSHQHVHRRAPLSSVFTDLAGRLGVPLRSDSSDVHYCAAFYGQTEDGQSLSDSISVEALLEVLAYLPLGFTELGCHPGYADDLDTMYRRERGEETKTLCDPKLRAFIADMGIELCSFQHVVLTQTMGEPQK